MMTFMFKGAYGEFDFLFEATFLNSGTIDLKIVKPKIKEDGTWELLPNAGLWHLGMVINYYQIGWTVSFQDDFFMFEPGKVRSKHDFGDCLMMDDKQAILERLVEAGWIKTNL